MLFTNTIDPPTLELLKSLQARTYLKGCYLVGGTALALYFGHRKSIDLDLFATSGQRSKDFIDIYYAFQKFSLDEMLDFYKQKYDQENDTHILKSLIYFDDVDLSDWPVLLQDPNLGWKEVVRKLESETLNYLKGKL
ncbi:MAG: nucleotidyl transferase AbiEii/AbiGii toxin family protein [Bacteroidales bacterium]|nr:nucleotidyl transferase AbiEii/AbiGii toxin family protein [Bacteroidales bacterium]